MSALLCAAAFGSADELRCLLDEGASVDERGPRGLTALMLAVHDPAKVALLLERGADPNAGSEWGVTALLLAAQTSGANESLRRLLERGAAVDCVSMNGADPLFGAASLGELDSLRALCDAGARFMPNGLGVALVYAASCGDVATARALRKLGAPLDAVAFQGYDPLTMATIAGYADFVDWSIEAGADLEARDAEGMTALAWAAKVDPGHSRIVERLIAAGADLESRSNDGRTPLDWALAFDNAAHAQVLRAALARRK